MRQPISGTAERIFMKLLPNDSGEYGVYIAIILWGLKTTQCALLHVCTGADAWRMTQNYFMVVRYCTAVALKRHERVNAFNLVVYNILCKPNWGLLTLIPEPLLNHRIHASMTTYYHLHISSLASPVSQAECVVFIRGRLTILHALGFTLFMGPSLPSSLPFLPLSLTLPFPSFPFPSSSLSLEVCPLNTDR